MGVLAIALSGMILTNAGRAQASCAAEPTLDGAVLEGTACSDVLVAPEGISSIEAGAGNDIIIGNQDVEEIDAGPGDDKIYAEGLPYSMENSAVSRNRRKIVRLMNQARAGNCDDNRDDTWCLTGGEDTERFGDGDQIIHAYSGDDTVWGGRGNDEIFGGDDNDRLFGSVGDDYLSGGNGNDRLGGGNGSDNIVGDNGDDYIHGDTVGDVRDNPSYDDNGGLHGGAGFDTLSFATSVPPGFTKQTLPSSLESAGYTSVTQFNNFPTVEDKNRGVYIDLTGTAFGGNRPAASNGLNATGGGRDNFSMTSSDKFEAIVGSAFSDVIVGDTSQNFIWGGGGADLIFGQGGGDLIYGGQDGDFIDGGGGGRAMGGEPVVSYITNGDGSKTWFNRDVCANVTAANSEGCEFDSPTNKFVDPPRPNQISVGIMNKYNPNPNSFQPGPTNPLQYGSSVYVVGTSASDQILVWFTEASGSQSGYVSIKSTGANPLDIQGAKANGCTGTSEIVDCPTGVGTNPTSYQLTPTVLVSGLSSNDFINSSRDWGGSSILLPVTTTKVLTGDDGGDTLKGDDAVQDILIDGAGIDNSFGFGSTDILYSSEGADTLKGGPDGDVLYTTTTCQGDIIDGEGGSDNITWAAWTPTGGDSPLPQRTQSEGVFASLKAGKAGDRVFGVSDPKGLNSEQSDYIPACKSTSGTRDTMQNIENLEGTSGRDILVGDEYDNTLLGRAGNDQLYGLAGPDKLRAASNDKDAAVECGAGSDKVTIDFARDDFRDHTNGECAGDEFIDWIVDDDQDGIDESQPYHGRPPEYDVSIDVEAMKRQLANSNDSALLGLFTLGDPFVSADPSGPTAWEATKEPKLPGFLWEVSGTYVNEGDQGDAWWSTESDSDPTTITDRAIDFTDDNAHSLDGVNDYIKLTHASDVDQIAVPPYYFEPTYNVNNGGTGFSVEFWARIAPPDPISGTNNSPGEYYLYYKRSSQYGVSIYHQVAGMYAAIVANIDRGPTLPDIFLVAFNSGYTAWKHYALTLDPSTKTATLYVNGSVADSEVDLTNGVIPATGSGVDATVGWGPLTLGGQSTTNYTRADFDNLAIYRSALPKCEVEDHYEIGDNAPNYVNEC